MTYEVMHPFCMINYPPNYLDRLESLCKIKINNLFLLCNRYSSFDFQIESFVVMIDSMVSHITGRYTYGIKAFFWIFQELAVTIAHLIIVCRISVPCLQKYLNLCKMITVFKTSHGYFEKGHFERRLFEIGPFEFFKNRLEMNQLKNMFIRK